ncbi:MAG: hypothetical protein QXU48_05985 [Thermoplasmata archaeon]
MPDIYGDKYRIAFTFPNHLNFDILPPDLTIKNINRENIEIKSMGEIKIDKKPGDKITVSLEVEYNE